MLLIGPLELAETVESPGFECRDFPSAAAWFRRLTHSQLRDERQHVIDKKNPQSGFQVDSADQKR